MRTVLRYYKLREIERQWFVSNNTGSCREALLIAGLMRL
jgi:hypothetical protein